MKSDRWSLRRAAALGAAIGAPFVVVREVFSDDGHIPSTVGEWTGLLLLGAVGGMVLFVLVAAVRRIWTR